MAIPARARNSGTYFVTSRTYNSRRLFQVEQNARLFLETLQHYRQAGRYKLHAFVAMPDHIHLLLTPTEDMTIERAVQLIKGGFSKRLNSKLPVWQRGFTDHRIRDREDWDKHVAYIHENPALAKLCQRAQDFPFSSAFRQTDLSTGAASAGQEMEDLWQFAINAPRPKRKMTLAEMNEAKVLRIW